MKAMSKFWMALVVGVAVIAARSPSWADPVSVPVVPSSDAQGWIGSLLDSATLTSTFTGGTVTSWVFNAKGAAAGLGFVYVYQVKNTFPSKDDPNIDNISFDLLGPIVTNPNLSYDKNKTLTTFAFQFDELKIGETKIKGNKTLIDATLASPVTFSFDKKEPGLEPKQTSMLFAFFSPAPPTTIDATIKFTNDSRATARVLTPSPEASVGVMFGLGLLGLPFFRKLRRRFTK